MANEVISASAIDYICYPDKDGLIKRHDKAIRGKKEE